MRRDVKARALSLAPPITESVFDSYRTVIAGHRELNSRRNPKGYHLFELLKMFERFYETGRSSLPGINLLVQIAGEVEVGGKKILRPSDFTIEEVPLEDPEIDRIDDVVPWDHELEQIQKVFEELDAPNCISPQPIEFERPTFDKAGNATGTETLVVHRRCRKCINCEATIPRDIAFHFQWYAWELFKDREPMTADLAKPV